jgi:hypothetical protein
MPGSQIMLRFSLIFAALLSLAGCQAGVMQTMQSAVWGPEPVSGHNLNPAFAYLRITTGKRVAFLALGNNEPHPQGLMEVWYSAEQEVIRLQNGRLAGAGGTRIEWRQVRLPALPSWRTLANREGVYTWERVRDVMPGYRFNVIDSLQLRVIAPPLRHQLQGIAPSSLTWFEEVQVSGSGGDPAAALPPARYAVEFTADAERVVYAEQCLDAGLCFSWQRWRAGQ